MPSPERRYRPALVDAVAQAHLALQAQESVRRMSVKFAVENVVSVDGRLSKLV